MMFLGLASNYKTADVWRHLFAHGTRRDSEELRQFLAEHYSSATDQALSAPAASGKHSAKSTTDKISPTRVALTHNGRSALAIAIKNSVPRGSAVAITGFTCYAVVQAVKAAHCTPVFVDIDRHTLNFTAKTLATALKKHPKTKAIILQNTLGNPTDLTKITKAARKLNLKIIEDLAHCAGRHYLDGREMGTVGDAVALSFGKGKSIDTISGGAVIIRDLDLKLPYQPTKKPPLADRLRDRWYPLLGTITRGLYHIKIGKYFMAFLVKIHFVQRSADAHLDTSVRLTHWQARLALRQLRTIPKSGRKFPLRRFLVTDHRDAALKSLAKKGYHFEDTWYEVPISPLRYYQDQHFPEKECPVATEVAAKIINLPSNCPQKTLAPAIRLITAARDEQLLVKPQKGPKQPKFAQNDKSTKSAPDAQETKK